MGERGGEGGGEREREGGEGENKESKLPSSSRRIIIGVPFLCLMAAVR